MRLKDNSVCMTGATPELLFGLNVADKVYADLGVEMIITSGNDGKHSLTSLHYSGNAADLRSKNIPGNPAKVAKEIKARLNIDYDVILESRGKPNEHIHLEWQPRRRD